MRAHRNIGLPLLTVALVAAAIALPLPAAADNEPVIVIPGRYDLPVTMYGFNISGAVLEGEWGLNRPGVVTPTIIKPFRPLIFYGSPAERYFPRTGHWSTYYDVPGERYFPRTGHKPRYGRHEIKPPPNRRLPKPAEPYHRSWSSESEPGSATAPTPYGMLPMVVSPQLTQPQRNPAPPHPRPPNP
jgi:hypothetical protein